MHPLTRTNFGTNTGLRAPIIHYNLKPESDSIEITAMPISAAEGCSRFHVFDYLQNPGEIKKFVIKTVAKAGGICPPLTIGIGFGGSFGTAGKLATLACIRNLAEKNSDPETARLEKELLEKINQLAMGPMSLGGDTTALAVNIEIGYTHSVTIPVAVRTQCWNNRHAAARITSDGETIYL
jgi:fumarate hydratase subunit alpha